MTMVDARVTRVLLVDDHALVRQSIAQIVGAEPDFDVIEASDPQEAAIVLGSHRPDVAVLDVSLPGGGGVELAAAMKRSHPAVRVMFLTMHDDDATIVRALGAGADGYVVKTATTSELLHALRAIAAGGSYLSPSVAKRVMNRGRSRDAVELTDRELEILRLLAQGARPAEVATNLFVSLRTVRNHLASIYVKLDVSSATQAIAEAYRRGLVTIR